VVVLDRKAKQEAPGLLPGSTQRGVLAGVLGAVCQAVGGVYSKKGMFDSEGVEVCGAIEATFIRLAIAAIATIVIVSLGRKLKDHLSAGLEWKTLRLLIPATAVGTWFGIWLSQIAYGHADVAIAQTLLATCPLFAIPIVALVYKHRITMLSVIGTLVALIGIYFTVFQSH
jgi:drug/metabolite transporter (DMT)-like permease